MDTYFAGHVSTDGSKRNKIVKSVQFASRVWITLRLCLYMVVAPGTPILGVKSLPAPRDNVQTKIRVSIGVMGTTAESNFPWALDSSLCLSLLLSSTPSILRTLTTVSGTESLDLLS